MYDVCYVISHGFVSRMLTQTDLLGKIRKKTSVCILMTKNDKQLEQYCDENKIDYFILPNNSKNFFEYYNKRRYFLEDIEKNPALYEKHIYATSINPSKNPLKLLKIYYYFLCYKLIKILPFIRNNFQKNEKKLLKNNDYEQIFKKINPRLFVSTYPVDINEASLLHYANKSKETKTCIHLLSWDNISCKGKFIELADKYVVWGKIMKDELEEYYKVSDKNIHVCGVPHFDIYQNQENNFKHITNNKPYMFFAMSAPRFTPNEIDIVEQLAELVSKDYFGNLKLVVRPHPQNMEGQLADKAWLPRLEAIDKIKNVQVQYPRLNSNSMPWSMHARDMYDLSNTLRNAELVINSGSTISLEAFSMKKDVILTFFDGDVKRDYWDSVRKSADYNHIAKSISYDCFFQAFDYKDLYKHIRNLYENKTSKIEKIEKYFLDQCLSYDGKSTDRVRDSLLKILNE